MYCINRPASESSTDLEDVLPENTLEVEKNLHASAIKNNLDDASVKKILKVFIIILFAFHHTHSVLY